MMTKIETFRNRQAALAIAHKMTVLGFKAGNETATRMIYVVEQDVTDPLTGEILSTHYDLVGAAVRPRRGVVIYDGVEEWDRQAELVAEFAEALEEGEGR